jgi:peptide chain release factor 1
VGVHRVQRVPGGETRRHTSTVTVAIVGADIRRDVHLDERDVHITSYRGSGPGGQHRNTRDTAVRVRHLPSGITVTAERERSWWQNRHVALTELAARVAETESAEAARRRNQERVAQVDVSGRGGHDWTWCAWRNTVTHHATGRRFPMDAALRGRLRLK